MRISDWSSDVCSSDLLRQEMTRHLYAVHCRDGGSLLPPRDAANPGHIGHDEIGRPSGDGRLQCLRPVEVLSDLQWGPQGPGESPIPHQVIMADRLLYPRNPLVIKRPATLQGLMDA